LGSLGNLSGGQVLLTLDTGFIVFRHQWVVLPMPPAVIDHVNLLGWHEPTILTFTDWQGRDIGDSNPQDDNSVGVLDDDLIIIHLAMKSQEWMRLRTLLKLQEWTLTLMSSPQEWIWTPMRGLWTPMSLLMIMLLQ
jgi:hypothetical protein